MLTRLNPRGQMFELESIENKTKISLVGTQKSIVVDANTEQLNQAWYNWVNGAFIQYAFKFLDANEREFLMTGITPEEWNELFGGRDGY